MRKTFSYRLYPTKAQTSALHLQLREACDLYNAALQERREAWSYAKHTISYREQAFQLREIRRERLTRLENHSCAQNVLKRLDRTFKAFFDRVKRGEKPGYPRFKAYRRFTSLTFPKHGDGIRLRENNKLYVLGVGEIKIKLHRPIDGQIKTVTIKQVAGMWFAHFSVICTPPPCSNLNPNRIGIDVGLLTFATLSDGSQIENPRHFKRAHARLKMAHRSTSRKIQGSKNRLKAIQRLQRAHLRVKNQRIDFHHKLSRQLVQNYGFIAIEKLHIRPMVKSWLANSVLDAAWGHFFQKLAYKAESAGCQLVEVPSTGTSQRCSRCGQLVPKTLKERWHDCPACGLSVSRDHNSALEILRLGLSLAGITPGNEPVVLAEAAD